MKDLAQIEEASKKFFDQEILKKSLTTLGWNWGKPTFEGLQIKSLILL